MGDFTHMARKPQSPPIAHVEENPQSVRVAVEMNGLPSGESAWKVYCPKCNEQVWLAGTMRATVFTALLNTFMDAHDDCFDTEE